MKTNHRTVGSLDEVSDASKFQKKKTTTGFRTLVMLSFALIFCPNMAHAGKPTRFKPLTISPNNFKMIAGSQKSFSASGGVIPYNFSTTAGSIINAYPATFTAPSLAVGAAPVAVTVIVKDSSGKSASAQVTVASKLLVAVSSAQLKVGSTYNIVATGGIAPYVYSFSGVGSLSGAIYSAGSIAGAAQVIVTDALKQTASVNFTIVAAAPAPIPALVISPTSFGIPFGWQRGLSASGGVAPYTFLASAGTISGNIFTAPSVAGPVTVSVRDSAGTVTSTIANVVSKLQLSSNTVQLNAGSSYTISALGGLAPYSYTLSGVGSLSGSIYSAGSIAGTAQATVKDALGQIASVSITVVAPIPPPPSSTAINALGTGIAAAYAPNCAPFVGTDFMEIGLWWNRRIEPRDCTFVRLSTPIFSWTMPTNISPMLPMNLIVRRPSDGYTLTRSTLDPRFLLADVTLASGSYEWSVNYTTTTNVVVNSQVRRFVIPNEANLLALPTAAAFTNIVAAKARPRALPAGSTFATIATKATAGEYKTAYTAFITKANTLLTAAVPAPPANLTRADFTSDLDYNTWQLKMRGQASTELVAIETLAYAGLFSGSQQYDTLAIQHIMALTAWDPNGVSSEAANDQANREIYLALGMSLDLFQNKLSAAQRLTIVTTLKNRLNQVMSNYYRFNTVTYDSHGLTALRYVNEALMYAVGTPEFPEANNLLMKSWNTMITMQSMWGGQTDSGWANGDAYGWFSMITLTRSVAAIKLISGLDLTRWAAVGSTIDNQIAVTPAMSPLRGQFGDENEDTSSYFNYAWDFVRLFASVSGRPEYEWYWRADPRNVQRYGYIQPMHYLLLGLRTPAAPVTTPVLPNSYLFEDAGVVAMHSSTTDTVRSSLYFRSSRFGSYNHSHADNNSFTFVSKGKEIFISGGYYPYYYSPHHAMCGRATRFKNAVTFNGGIGQAEPSATPTAPGAPIGSMETRGQLLNFTDNGTVSVATGDASLAYRGQDPITRAFTPLLTNAVRSVVYNRQERVAVIYDYATSAVPRTWELNFQSLVMPTLVGQTVHILNGTVEACMDIYGTAGSYAFSSGFPIAPEAARPEQYHTRYSASAPSNQLVSVTVIREDCRAVPVRVNVVGTSAGVSINGGAAITFDRKTVTSP